MNNISRCSTDDRLLVLLYELDTLNSRICSLIELTRKKFYGKQTVSGTNRSLLFPKDIYRRFSKDTIACSFKCLIRYILHIITIQDTHILYVFDSKIIANLMCKCLLLDIIAALFLNIHSSYITHSSSSIVFIFLFGNSSVTLNLHYLFHCNIPTIIIKINIFKPFYKFY